MEKENIGIFVRTLKNGGAERAAANLSKDLSDNYNVYLILFDSSDIAYPYEGTILDLKFEIGRNVFQKALNFIRMCSRLRKVKRQFSLKATISFMEKPNLYNVLTSGRRCGKTIVSVRNRMSSQATSALSRFLLSYCAKKADATVALSEGVREDLIENFGYQPEKTVTIYNSCDSSWFLRDSAQVDRLMENFDFSRPVIATAGRSTYQKGQWHLLRAFSIVRQKIPECRLVVFGEGELADKLKAYAKALRLEENVLFMGFVKNHHKFLQQCDAFVFSSVYEGLGNVLLEALACGLPVVSVDCPFGPHEILNGDCGAPEKTVFHARYGILTPPVSEKEFDVEDLTFEDSDRKLADAIVELLSDKTLQQHYKAQAEKRSADFMPGRIRQCWIDLIERD